MRVIRHRRCIGTGLLLLAFLAAALPVPASESSSSTTDFDWAGFRGLKRHGVSATPEGPVTWSRSDNIRWATDIVGAGCSSPVVVDGRIYVTTSHLAEESKALVFAASLVPFVLLSVLTVFGLGVLVQSCQIDRTGIQRVVHLGSVVFFSLLLGLVALLITFGPDALDYRGSAVRRWLAASSIASICFLLAGYAIPRGSVRQAIAGVALLCFGVFIVAGVPNKELIFSGSFLDVRSSVVFAVGGIPVFLGISCLLSFLLAGRRASRQDAASVAAVPKRLIVSQAALCASGVLPAVILGCRMIWKVPATARIDPVWETISTWPAIVAWTLGALFAGACFLCWTLAGPAPSARRQDGPDSRTFLLRLCALSTAILLSLTVAVVIPVVLVKHARYIAYHFANIEWHPELGWSSVATLLSICGLALVVLVVVHLRCRPAPAYLSSAFSIGILLLGILQFSAVVYVPGSQVMVRAIVCLDEDTGQIAWTCPGLPGPEGPLHRLNSPATPTPVVRENRVFAHFGSAGVMCTDLDGSFLWANPEVTFTSVYGVGASPVADEGILVIVNGMPDDPYLCGLDCLTGDVVWRKEMPFRRRWLSGNSRTPTIRDIGGRSTLLVWGFSGLFGYDLHSGDELWSHRIDVHTGDHVSSPVFDERVFYCVSTCKALAYDMSKLSGSDDPVVWKTRVTGPNSSSPVLCNGMLFFVTDMGIASCLDAKSGKKLWRQRLKGHYYASPVAIGNRVYFCNVDGLTTVIVAEADFRTVAENDLAEQVLASFAPRDGALIVRTRSQVLCIASQDDGDEAGP